MNEIINFIQKEALKIYKKKYNKNYISLNIVPIIEYINSSNNKKFLIGGSQGIGKSSLIEILKKTLEKYYNKKVLSLSLDNYYLSKNERGKLANNIHQLLKVRGVPGTHNVKKLIQNIEMFDKNSYPIITPLFDKLIDNQLRKKNIINKKCDILILEGWCCGCNPIEKKYLCNNINSIETKYDKNFKWRNYYNNKLKYEYKKLFNLFDQKIFIKAPSFNHILQWRLNQENNNHSIYKTSKKMNKKEIKIFIQHYEKITKWMLKNYKKNSNIIVKVNKDQKINSIIKN